MPRRLHFPATFTGPVMLSCVLWLGMAGQSCALDFQLHPYQVQEDGFTWERNYIQQDAKTRVSITPPPSWNNVGEAQSLTMTPPSPVGSQAKIERSPFTSQVAFQDKGLEAYRQRALASVPSGATNARILGEHDNAFPFFNWKGFEFVLSYEYFGQSFQRSLLFVNVDANLQLMASSVAPTSAYKQVHAALMDVLRSWQPLEP